MTVTRRSRAQIEELLTELSLAGPNLAHSRETNVENVHRLVAGDPGVTLGIDLVHERLRTAGPLDPQEALDLIAGMTGCSKDIGYRAGLGYIDPAATYEGLREAALAIRGAVEREETFLFASGHPENMDEAYEELAAWVRERGCSVIAEEPVDIVHHDVRLALDGSVYAVERNGQTVHTHDYQPMEELLKRLPPVGFAVADHGFAGATLNRGIPTVCVMDTNDPGVAIAGALGAPVIVVPLNDNCPAHAVRAIAGIIRELAEGPDVETA